MKLNILDYKNIIHKTDIDLDDVDFINVHADSANVDGGAVYIRASSITSFDIDNSRFINVSSSRNGGAIYYDVMKKFTISNSLFENITSSNGIIHIVKNELKLL